MDQRVDIGEEQTQRKNIIKIKIPGIAEFEIRGFTVIITLLLATIVANTVLLFLHINSSGEMTKAIKHLTIMTSFQACLLGTDQNDRKAQLQRGSDCWYMARGYDYGSRGISDKE